MPSSTSLYFNPFLFCWCILCLQEKVASESLPLLGFTVRLPDKQEGEEEEANIFQLYHKNTLYYTFKAVDNHTAQRWAAIDSCLKMYLDQQLQDLVWLHCANRTYCSMKVLSCELKLEQTHHKLMCLPVWVTHRAAFDKLLLSWRKLRKTVKFITLSCSVGSNRFIFCSSWLTNGHVILDQCWWRNFASYQLFFTGRSWTTEKLLKESLVNFFFFFRCQMYNVHWIWN